jgi:hypothetical protein
MFLLYQKRQKYFEQQLLNFIVNDHRKEIGGNSHAEI